MRILFCLLLLCICACSKKQEAPALNQASNDQETTAADNASLIAVAKEAGISEEEALREKAKFDAIYDKTSTEMKTREQERNERDASFKKDTCVADCEE